MGGDECVGRGACVVLNVELHEVYDALGEVSWELYAACDDFIGLYDPSAGDETSERCGEAMNAYMQLIQTSYPDFLCVYTRFMGHGCDRCVALEPITPWPCLKDIMGSADLAADPCEWVTCAEGQECDPDTGLCCDIGGECQTLTFDLCDWVTCEPGFVCKPSVGMCWNPETDECAELPFPSIGW